MLAAPLLRKPKITRRVVDPALGDNSSSSAAPSSSLRLVESPMTRVLATVVEGASSSCSLAISDSDDDVVELTIVSNPQRAGVGVSSSLTGSRESHTQKQKKKSLLGLEEQGSSTLKKRHKKLKIASSEEED